MQMYTLTHDTKIYIQTILLLMSLSPSTLCAQLYSSLPNKKAINFWYFYSFCLLLISVAGIQFLHLKTWWIVPTHSYLVALQTLGITILAFLAEDYIAAYINRKYIQQLLNCSSIYTQTTLQEKGRPDNSFTSTDSFQGFTEDADLQYSWIPKKGEKTLIPMIVAFATIGLLEEIVFRGVLLQTILVKTTGLTCYLLVGVQVLAFAFAHVYFAYYQIMPKFFFGLLLTLLTLQTKSLLPCMISHALFNIAVIYKTRLSKNYV